MAKHAKHTKHAKSQRTAKHSLERALALRDRGDAAAALVEVGALLEREPRHEHAWTLYGHLLEQRGERARSEEAYRRAVEANPRTFSARVNLGVLLVKRGALPEALAQYEQALAVAPDHALALRNYGGILRKLGQLERAEAVLRRAAALDTTDSGAQTNLGLTLSDLGRHDDALLHLAAAVQCDPSDASAHHARLLVMNYASAVTPEQVFEAHRAYGTMIEASHRPLAEAPPVPLAGRKLRVGFVSADLRRHSVAFFLEPLLAHLAKDEFELYAYSTVQLEDEVTVRLREHIAVFRDVAGLDDHSLALRIRADHVDVLIDLNGHTAHNRLSVFALRPAPVQLTYLGYPNTTGLTRIQYRITDAECDPPGSTEPLHSERLLRLDGGFLCYQPPTPCPEPAPCPSSLGHPLTFGSFNAVGKLSDHVLRLWTRILREAEDAQLLIKHLVLSSDAARSALNERLRALGAPLERVELMGKVIDTSGHLASYARMDVALDTFPYHGTTTTCDALWMGVPVVSLAGTTHASRVGVSLLTRVGLRDLIADSDDAYVARAIALGRDTARRAALRGELRARMEHGGLLDGARLARALGAALKDAYARYHAEACLRVADGSLVSGPANDQTRQEAPSTALPDPDCVLRELPGGLRLAAPGLELFEGYVLAERGDWYEEELRFVRRLLAAGEHVLDLGSGTGVYGLAMADLVGPGGRVWACSEQARDVARLAASAELNRLPQLSVSAHLPGAADGQRPRFVRVSPVDVPNTDLDGLAELCLAGDPLVMVEVARDPAVGQLFLDALVARGAQLYRLVPGLTLLFPHPPGTESDPFLTNVFAARPERAAALAAAGLLAEFLAHAELPSDVSLLDLFADRPATRELDAVTAFLGDDPARMHHRDALLHFAWASRAALPASERAYALRKAVEHALASIADPTDVSRLSTLARVAAAWGRRAIAVEAVDAAIAIQQTGRGRLGEPCLPACARYDAIPPGERFAELVLSALLELRERAGSHSSFFTRDDPASLARLEYVAQLGFQDRELAFRLSMTRKWRAEHPTA